MINKSMDALVWLRKQLETDDNDLLREMVRSFAEELMAAEADVICGAPYGEISVDRVNRRNGYRSRRWDTRTGSIDRKIPKLRTGSYFPDWLLDARTRSERAFIQVVTEAYVRGVSTRRVEGLVETLGITSRTAQQRDPAPGQRRRDLPHPDINRPPRRRPPRRTTARIGPSPAAT